MIRRIASSALHDRALVVGTIGGILVTIAGLIGYIGIPFLTGEEAYLSNAVMGAGFHMPEHSLWYHGTVVVLPAFLASLSGTLLTARWGLTERTSKLKLVGSVIIVPHVAIVIAYFVTAIAIGVLSVVTTADGSTSIGETALSAVFVFLGMTGLALVFGVIAVAYAVGFVAPSVCIGAIGGYLVARGFLGLRKNHFLNESS